MIKRFTQAIPREKFNQAIKSAGVQIGSDHTDLQISVKLNAVGFTWLEDVPDEPQPTPKTKPEPEKTETPKAKSTKSDAKQTDTSKPSSESKTETKSKDDSKSDKS